MKTKTFNLLFASVFAMIFLMGFSSAAITLIPSVSTLPQTSSTFNLTVLSTENETIDLSIPSISDGSGHTIDFALSPPQVTTNTVSGSSKVVNVTYVVDSGFNFEFTKTYNANLTSMGGLSGQVYKLLPFASSGFCEVGNLGELKTTIEDVRVSAGYGSGRNWYPFDTVEVDVKVKNNGNEDLNSVSVEWGLYDTQSKTWAINVNEEDNFDLNSGDDQTLTVTFTLDNNMDENLQDLAKGDYIFYVRATGQISGGDNDGQDTCSSDSDTGTLKIDKNSVVLKNINIPDVVQCDSDFYISGDAWNIGSKNQNNVYALVYNKDLGINNVKVDVGDINSFDSSNFDFNFTVPSGIQEKTYPITITMYDDSDNIYKVGSDKSVSTVNLKVQGNCAPKASVAAVLQSGGQAGKTMTVKATITNTGNTVAYYTLNVAGYTGWASTATLDKNSLSLNPGESQDVLLTFNVNKDAIGTQLFNIEVLSGNQLVVSQPVQIEVTKRSFSLGNLFSGGNGYIWGIGLLNLILIILIIVIAVRIARK